MNMEEKIVMLTADTARTSAYAQALANAQISISNNGLIVPETPKWGQISSPDKVQGQPGGDILARCNGAGTQCLPGYL